MLLNLKLRTDDFANSLANEILSGGLTVVDAIERLLGEHLEETTKEALGDRLLKAPRANVHPFYFKNRFENLAGLRKHGYQTWYPEVQFVTRKGEAVSIDDVDTTGFNLGSIRYGHGIERSYRYTQKELKTQINHCVRLNEVMLPSEIFDEATRIVREGGDLAQPYIANLALGPQLDGFRVVAFDHIITGERRYCRCHYEAHKSMLSDARKRAPSYAADSWPHQVISLLERATYSDDLCHFCVAKIHGEDRLSDWYGDQIQMFYEPYVDVLIRSNGMDSRTALAEAKRLLSLSRWVKEAELFNLVSKLFPANTIRREASPSWLGRQRLDIYLPELSLALEYQGEQHFRPIEVFGGEEAFLKNQERDERKRALCQENGVTVVDVRFDESLTLPRLRSRLRRWLEN